jgi:putative SOS response-associated peptidase YedK
MSRAMCGRFLLNASPEELRALFGYLDAVEFPPRYNIAPTQPIAVVRIENRQRRFALVRWGLVPPWVKDPRAFGLLVNARSESAATNGAFKGALAYRRCLVPASGFYEWRKDPANPKGRRKPYVLRPRNGGVIALAGLWETWLGADGSEIDTGCILTSAANDTVAAIHDRMPVIIGPGDFERWLTSAEPVGDLMRPAANDLLVATPVTDRVNKADNDGPRLLEPAEEDPRPARNEPGLPLFDR